MRLKALEQPILFVGTDVDIFWENIVQMLGDYAVRAPFNIDLPRATEVIHIATKMELPSVEATHHFVPQYKRIAEAEANWLKEQKEKEHD